MHKTTDNIELQQRIGFVGLLMECSDVPAASQSGPITKRRSKKNILIVMAAVVIVIVIIAAAVLMFSPPGRSRKLPYGLQGGDHFIYDATGSYNNSRIAGIYDMTLVGNVSRSSAGGYDQLNSTIPELNRLMNQGGLNFLMAQGYDIGVGRINTTYGEKDVNQIFDAKNGAAVVYYQGSDPLAIYGCVANGPNFHLSLILNQTNNRYVIDNNTPPEVLPPRQAAVSGIYRYMTIGGDVQGQLLYLPNGANFCFNITGNGTDMYTYSEANILSMVNGGQFTYYSPMTKLNVTSSTGDLVLPPGYYITAIFTGNAPGEYDCDLKVL